MVYQALFIPGLLQTEDYARAITSALRFPPCAGLSVGQTSIADQLAEACRTSVDGRTH